MIGRNLTVLESIRDCDDAVQSGDAGPADVARLMVGFGSCGTAK